MVDISVITPTFRRPGPLAEAITSVLSQTGVSVEIIVLDDSPEGSAQEVVERLGDPRIRYQKMPVPTGGKPALVRNTGIPLARGQYVHFLDDDDRVPPGTYAATKAALDREPSKGIAFGRIEPFGDNPESLEHEAAFFADAARRAKRCQALRGTRRLMAATMLFHGTVLVCSATLIRRECLNKTSGFNAQLTPVEDVCFYIQAIRRFGCVFLEQTVLHYRISHNSLMHNSEDKTKTDVVGAYNQIFKEYRHCYGTVEFLTLKILMRTVLKKL